MFLYIVKQNKSEKLLEEKNSKIRKQSNAFKGFACSYNVEILDSFNPELELKDTQFGVTGTFALLVCL